MKIRGVSRLHRAVGHIRHLFQRRAVILLYHRVAELQPDPQLLCVSPSNFAEHLEQLRRHYRPISLKALGQALTTGNIPDKAVVVTFDDGYADNFRNAKSLLERYDIPATLFVITGFIGQNREFPSDVLERCLLSLESLPNSLTMVINGKTYSWQIDDTKKDYPATWDVTMGFYPTLRHQCYSELHKIVRFLNDVDRQKVLKDLIAWASCPDGARPTHRPMNLEELRELSKNSLIEIGAHTVNHLLLAAQPADTQLKEIKESKRYLEQMLGIPVTSFSYPYGGTGDVSRDTIAIVRNSGFKLACANVPAPITSHSAPCWLPRYLVRNWDGKKFAKQLRGAFYG